MRFNDIFGNTRAKEQLSEIIDFFKHNKQGNKFKSIGAKLKKGVLLYGPPGTGKTMLAKALAGEASVNFLYRCASEFIEKFVGVGSARVRELFYLADSLKPCIIFIDEIDTLGSRVRGSIKDNHNANMEINSTVNQLLVELDGFRDREDIVVIAATNNIHAIDPALIRSGRFDVKIETKLPDAFERAGIISKKLEKVKSAVDLETITNLASEFDDLTGADIDSIVNEALYITVRKQEKVVSNQSILTAFQEFELNLIKEEVKLADNKDITKKNSEKQNEKSMNEEINE